MIEPVNTSPWPPDPSNAHRIARAFWANYYLLTEEFDRSLPHVMHHEEARVHPCHIRESMKFARDLEEDTRTALGVASVSKDVSRAMRHEVNMASHRGVSSDLMREFVKDGNNVPKELIDAAQGTMLLLRKRRRAQQRKKYSAPVMV